MSSPGPESTASFGPWSPDDLTPQARIRHAALSVFGEHGFEKATVRMIAALAGVSPALIMHHYGSKDGLRQACDDWVMRIVSDEKSVVARGGSLPELQVYLARHPEMTPMMTYIVTALRHGGDLAQGLYDRFCAVTADLLDTGIAAGTMRQPTDRDATIAVLVAYSAGASLLGDLLARRLGGESLLDPQVYQRYALASVELFTHGMFTDDRYLDQIIGTSPREEES